MTSKDPSAATEADPTPAKKRTRVSQADLPAYSLREALTVAEALRDDFAKRPTTALLLAKTLNLTPNSSTFRMLTGAALAYGLTDAGGQAARIGLTDLGKRAVAPTKDGDDFVALRQAGMTPRVPREFLTRYDGSRIPSDKIAENVLEEIGVPKDSATRALALILDNAEHLGLIETVKGSRYVALDRLPDGGEADDDLDHQDVEDEQPPPPAKIRPPSGKAIGGTPAAPAEPTSIAENKRVFITHGKNREIVAQLKEVLSFGGFEPVVSVEIETAAKAVPDKVMDDMRSCSAGIVHVGNERTLLDSDGTEHKVLNPNVLIEIGAALALYRGRLILLVEEGTDLPSNLQGLYQARFSGGKLDYDATMKLLRTFNEFRQQT